MGCALAAQRQTQQLLVEVLDQLGRLTAPVERGQGQADGGALQEISSKLDALVQVKGVCTVRVIEADSQSATPFVVTEYAPGPSLSEYIDKHGSVAPGMLFGLATGLAEALTTIHAAAYANHLMMRMKVERPRGDGGRVRAILAPWDRKVRAPRQ